MSITVSRSEPADRPAILALLAEARGGDLSDDERARRGFVQGRMDDTMLAEFQAGTGVFVARDGTELAGVTMTSLTGTVAGGPPKQAITAVTETLPQVPEDELFLYGPAAIDRRYQGQGILTELLRHVCAELSGRFTLGVAFVELANPRSLAIHRHYPMSETTGFTLRGREYRVFTFSPGEVLRHYPHDWRRSS